ncbi:g10515 [Coccomyxa elongata]
MTTRLLTHKVTCSRSLSSFTGQGKPERLLRRAATPPLHSKAPNQPILACAAIEGGPSSPGKEQTDFLQHIGSHTVAPFNAILRAVRSCLDSIQQPSLQSLQPSSSFSPWAAAALQPAGLLSHVEALVASSGAFGPLLFAAFYAAGTATFLPAAPLSIAAGYLFGPLLGIPVVSIASTAGCALAFALSRSVARPLLEPHLRTYSKFQRIDRAVAAKAPAKTVFLLRLSPLIPLTLLSYVLGATSVGFWPYMAASWAGLLPISVVYVVLGGASKGAMSASGGQSRTVRLVLAAVGILATLAATRLISKIAADALKDAPESAGPA